MSSQSTLRLRPWISAAIASVLLAGCATGQTHTAPAGAVTIGADHASIRYSGRTETMHTGAVTFGWSGARVRLRFQGAGSVGAWLNDESGENHMMVWVDGAPGKKFRLGTGNAFYALADGLGTGEHTVEVVRVTEGSFGLTHFKGFVLDPGATPLPWHDAHQRRIEFIGDSITCGYGVEVDDPNLHFEAATENFCLGYSGLAARRLDADWLVVSRSGIGMVRNYDGPREGSEGTMPQVYPHTFYMRPEKDWDFGRFTPDVVCLNLGTNDFSTTGVNVEKFVAAYGTFANQVLVRYPKAKLVILQGPMNTSAELRAALDSVIANLGKETANRVHFLALSAQGTVGLGADYHPNRAQSEINAAELTAFLRELMDWR